jgi:transcriptional regulator with XRE-family HTH domain
MAKMSEFPERIKILRVKQGMNQTELGNYLGVGQTAVSKWETGENPPPAEALVKMGNMEDYPDCLFFYEKAGMDLRRVSQVGKALDVCLDFIKWVDSRTYDQLHGRILGMDREEQLSTVLESMAGLGGLSPVTSRFLDEAVPAVLQLVEEIDPGAARELRQHVGGYGSAYDQIKYMRSAVAKILHLKPKKHPWERDPGGGGSLGQG